MAGGSLAIVEKKPPFGSGSGAGGCAGGVLFHLLDWHRRLARKRRLFSPRRLLPSAVRSPSSTRKLLPPPAPSPAPGPPTRSAMGTDAGQPDVVAAAPGVVARLMGLESWPSDAPSPPGAAPRPQKQRKVEPTPAAAPSGEDNTMSSVVVMLPPSRRPLPPAPPHPQAHAPPRSHHSADLPARSPRRTRPVHAAAATLLDPAGARGGSRARLHALAYACSSPQHRGHAGCTLEDFLSRSEARPADTERDNAVGSRWRETRSVNTMSVSPSSGAVMGGSDTIVIPRTDFCDGNTRTGTSDVDASPKDSRLRTGGMGVRSSNAGAGARTGEPRLLRKRGTFSRPDAPRSVGSGNLASSIGNAREMTPGDSNRRAAHNSGPRRRESMSSITPQRSNRREVIDRSGLASTSRNASNVPGQRRGPHKKIDRGTAGSNNREDRNAVASAGTSSTRPVVSKAPSLGKDSDKRRFRSTQSDASCARTPVVEASPSSVALSEKEEFSRLLKAKINELGLSDRVEPSDAHSANLTVSLLQELISALTDDTNTSASQSSNYSDSSAPLNNADTVCNSNDQSPVFQKCYQGDQEADSSATCTNDEPNQPSPTSVLEACFSNDASSLGSPVEKNAGKEFFVSMESKMEDLFNLDSSDIVDLAMSIDTTKNTDANGSGKTPRVESFAAARDFKFLEHRLHDIGEAIANAELLLDDSSLFCGGTPSTPSLHSFIVEMLETVEGYFGGGGGSEILVGFKEENCRYHRTNFLFDCIVESLDSKLRDFGKCGYTAWLRLPLTLSKEMLKREVSEEIGSWRGTSEVLSSNQAAEKELYQASWDACRVEAFDISVAIEDDILEALVGEFASDQCC